MNHDEDEQRYMPRPTGPGISDPAAMAVASLVVGALSLGGFGLLNGANFVYPLTDGVGSAARAILAGLLGASFALAAAILGVVAARRTHPGDPHWVARIAQAGVLVATVAFVLRLVATSIAAVEVSTTGYTPPL